MRTAQLVALAALVIVVVTLQVSVLTHLSVAGVVPDLVLVLVVAAALVRGPQSAAALGFVAGLALDLTPPADHTLGRWALTFVVVGYLAGLVRQDARQSSVAAAVVVAASSFVGTSLFALSGIALGDPGNSVSGALQVIPIAVVYDVAIALLILPVLSRLLTRLQPETVRL